MATPSQKVIIPKGLVNPYETTIIEIPKKLQNKPAVVARPKSSYLGNRYKWDNNTFQDNVTTFNKQREEFLNYLKSTVSKNAKYLQERGDVNNAFNCKKVTNTKYDYHHNNNDDQRGDIEENVSENSIKSLKETQKNINTIYVNPSQRGAYGKYKKNRVNVKQDIVGINSALDEMENVELERIQKDVKEFQEARRKLILHATNLQS